MHYQVNDLLTLTRLPIAYWQGMNATRDFRDNPGKQLQSWVVAKCLDQEDVVIDPVLIDVVNACEAFSANHDEIKIWLIKSIDLFFVDLTVVPNTKQLEIVTIKLTDLRKRLSESIDYVHDRSSIVSWYLDVQEDFKLITEQVGELLMYSKG